MSVGETLLIWSARQRAEATSLGVTTHPHPHNARAERLQGCVLRV